LLFISFFFIKLLSPPIDNRDFLAVLSFVIALELDFYFSRLKKSLLGYLKSIINLLVFGLS
jgi:hypothetical protein